jgi:hypothetical protein
MFDCCRTICTEERVATNEQLKKELGKIKSNFETYSHARGKCTNYAYYFSSARGFTSVANGINIQNLTGKYDDKQTFITNAKLAGFNMEVHADGQFCELKNEI